MTKHDERYPGCTYLAKTNWNLRQHVLSHCDERLYACDWPGCEWKFKSKYHRNKHFETHSDQKNMVCDCGKRFKTKHYLSNHKRYCYYNK